MSDPCCRRGTSRSGRPLGRAGPEDGGSRSRARPSASAECDVWPLASFLETVCFGWSPLKEGKVCAVAPAGQPPARARFYKGYGRALGAGQWRASQYREGAAATLRIEGDATAAPFVLAGATRRPGA